MSKPAESDSSQEANESGSSEEEKAITTIEKEKSLYSDIVKERKREDENERMLRVRVRRLLRVNTNDNSLFFKETPEDLKINAMNMEELVEMQEKILNSMGGSTPFPVAKSMLVPLCALLEKALDVKGLEQRLSKNNELLSLIEERVPAFLRRWGDELRIFQIVNSELSSIAEEQKKIEKDDDIIRPANQNIDNRESGIREVTDSSKDD